MSENEKTGDMALIYAKLHAAAAAEAAVVSYYHDPDRRIMHLRTLLEEMNKLAGLRDEVAKSLEEAEEKARERLASRADTPYL